MSKKHGIFISLEGGEGGGKSTQSVRLAAYLREQGIEVVETREPGGTDASEDLRDLLTQGDPARWSPFSELLLMTAARTEHVAHRIAPALAEGKWVVCDRFYDSTLVYQGIAGGIELAMVQRLQDMAVGGCHPDATFVLDVPPDAGLERVELRGGGARFEKKGVPYHKQVRDGFLQLAAQSPARISVVDAQQNFEDVHKAIVQILHDKAILA